MNSCLHILSNAVNSYGDYVVVFNERKEIVYSNNVFLSEFKTAICGVSFDNLHRSLDKKNRVYFFINFLEKIASSVINGEVYNELYMDNDRRVYAVHCHVFSIGKETLAICWRMNLSISFEKHGLSISDPLQDSISNLFNHRAIAPINIDRGYLICVSIDKVKTIYNNGDEEYIKKIKKIVSSLLTDECHNNFFIYLNEGGVVVIVEERKKESYKIALKIKKKLFLISKSENYSVDFYVNVKSFTNDSLLQLLNDLKK